MRNRPNSGNLPSDRWSEPTENYRHNSGSHNQRSENENPENDRFYQPQNRTRNRRSDFDNDRYTSYFENTSEERGFGSGGNFGGAQNYGQSRQYGGSNQSGGGGSFGSPSDYGAGGSGGNYSGGYYGSSGSYGGGSNYRGGSSYAGGGNYSNGPGAAYPSGPMPSADDSAQGSYHGRTGYRSNYQAIQGEFDAVMEDPTTSSGYNYGNRQHARNYRDYDLDDNYGSMDGRYSGFNNYDGRTRNNPASRWSENDRDREQRQSWLDRAADQARSWFGNRDNDGRNNRW